MSAIEPGQPSDPLVSICLPVYNGEPFLAQAIRSVLDQTHTKFELLIFDDGSTDASCSVIAGFHDARLILHCNARNLGPEGNWNLALSAARGKYVKVFHQDDLMAATCLERQVAALEGDPEAVLTFCSRTIIRPDGKRLLTRRAPWRAGPVTTGEVVRGCVLAGTNLIGEPSAVLFRREAACAVGGFDGRVPYLIDLDYWLRLLSYGTAHHLNEPLVSFRVSRRQWSAAIGLRQGREFISFMDHLPTGSWLPAGRGARLVGGLRAQANGLLRALVYRFLVGSE